MCIFNCTTSTQEAAVVGLLNRQQTLPHLTLRTTVVAQSVQWMLKAGLLMERYSTKKFQLLLQEVNNS